jgi:hypothetical protein
VCSQVFEAYASGLIEGRLVLGMLGCQRDAMLADDLRLLPLVQVQVVVEEVLLEDRAGEIGSSIVSSPPNGCYGILDRDCRVTLL